MGVPGKGAALEFSCLPSSFEAFKVFHILISAQLLATSSRAKRPVSYADVVGCNPAATIRSCGAHGSG